MQFAPLSSRDDAAQPRGRTAIVSYDAMRARTRNGLPDPFSIFRAA